ncbi:MAG TPA: VOC family protein [Roseiflexaceae bacterium]|nr:VOC family protein [Roseiflexaceae bacterium]
MVIGINHVTLSIAEIERSFAFYTGVLGFQPIAKWPKGAYLLAGDLWLALVVDPHARQGPLAEYTHLAFSVSKQHFGPLSEHIRRSGAVIWQENWTEGDSLYFLDPDGHKLEIHASDLATRIATAKAQPWDGLEFFV